MKKHQILKIGWQRTDVNIGPSPKPFEGSTCPAGWE